MLIIDCKEVESIQHELAVYVSDQVGAVPNLKYHEFILSPIEDDGMIDTNLVITSIKEFLASIGETYNFAVISKDDTISIESIRGKVIDRHPKPKAALFSCPHCGFMTQYEVEYNTHKKIHYLG